MDPTAPDRPLLAHRLSRTQLIAFDGAVALGYLGLLLSMTTAAGTAPLPPWARFALTAATVLPVAARRVWPVPVFGVVLALTIVSTLLRLNTEPFVAAAYAIYPVALERSRPWRMPAPVAVLAGVAIVLVVALGMGGSGRVGAVAPHPPWWLGSLSAFVFGCALMAGVWTVGSAVRERRAYAARAAERLAEKAATDERLRIARELHDVVAHGMSLIAVKAGVANHVLRERPEEAHDALRLIETTSRSALTELRSMLGVLRSGDAPPADLGPAPGLARLPELVERAAMAGVRAETDVRGADGLPEGLELAVFRIVQEALTNVVKHAAPARCRIAVTVADGAVTVEVTDDGPGVRVLPGAPSAGHGLVGMRERAAVYGGDCTTGPLPGGGFRVRARIPVPS
ncbi:MAG TPA: sensor histidine kinase [Streptosporangiaceae bacterium]